MKGQNAFDRLPDLIAKLKRYAGLGLLFATLKFEPEFDEEQFLEDDADVGGRAKRLQILHALAFVRPMHSAEGFARAGQLQPLSYGWRNRLDQLRRQVLESSVDYASKPARSQPALTGRFVYGHDASDLERLRDFLFCFVVSLADDFKLRLLQFQLTAVVLHFSIQGHQLAGLKLIFQIGAVEPDA